MTAVRKPEGRAVPSPTRITSASLDRSEPFGFSRASVSLVTGGGLPPSVRRIGALIGGPARTAALTASCHEPWSTSTTASGRFAEAVAGKRALATPAASVIASPPPTRIVLRVALAGKPSLLAAFVSLDLAPI